MKKRILAICFGLLFVTGMAMSQNSNDARDITKVYYLKNAFVVQKPGTILPKTSVIIRDGLIEAIGNTLSVPFDAKVIDVDSMYLYAGFIDACSHSGIKEDEKKEQPKAEIPGNPPKSIAGITPQATTRESLNTRMDKSLEELRDLGFTYVHIVPRGGMLPGQGSIVTTGGGSIDNIILKENISLFGQFKPARGMRPGTTIGVMSQLRDLYYNAANSEKYAQAFNINPLGLERPSKSEELEAMYPLVTKKMPLFFYTPKVKDVNRALNLQKEMGFNMVLTGVRQGWPLMSKIKASNNPVLLSLHLPAKPEEKKDDGDKDKKDKKDDKPKGDEESPETIALKEKVQLSNQEYTSQASIFRKNGINFSFSTLDTKAKDIKPNLLRMIESGLSENDALAALTTNPASLLGISALAGTVEVGKIANIFVSDKPYFTKESKIKYSIVDGVLKENKEKKSDKKPGTSNGGIDGTWSYEVAIPGETQRGTLIVTKNGDEYDVKIDSSDDPGNFDPASNVKFDNGKMSFSISVEGMIFNIDINMDDSAFEGTVSAEGMGTFPMTGSKSNPE